MRRDFIFYLLSLSLILSLTSACTAMRFKHDFSKPESLPYVYESLETGTGRDKISAMRALVKFHQDVPDLKKRLLTAQSDKIWEVRWEASRQLVRLGHHNEGLKGFMAFALHPDADVKINAINVIKNMGYRAKAAIPVLQTLVTKQPLGVERAAKSAIAAIEADILRQKITKG